MVWGWNRTATNPMVVKCLLGMLVAGLFVVALFQQPWIPVEISAPETGVLVAMPSPLLSLPSTEEASPPDANTPLNVPIAQPTDSDDNQSIPVVQTAGVTPVHAPEARSIPTYSQHIAPLLNRHCVACHRGEDATLNMVDPAGVIANASQIAEATKTRRMPPWKPQPGFGRFRNERRLTDAEIALIQDWVMAGAPLGEQSAIPTPNLPESEWGLGKPTVAYQLPNVFQVPASEEGLTWNFVIPTGVERDLYLTSAELRPGNKALIQRMTLSFDPTGTAREKDKNSPQPGFASDGAEKPIRSNVLAEWMPGMIAMPLPQGTGYHIPQGADLVLTVDYAASAVAAPDPWRMGLHITRTAPKHRLGRIEISSRDTVTHDARRLTANETKTIAAYELPTEVLLYSIRPESGQSGCQMRAFAVTPEGENIPLLFIENWDMNWQDRYYFREPIQLAKGTRVVFETSLHRSVSEFGRDRANLCEFEVSTPNPAHLEALLRHNQSASLQP